MPFRKSLFVFLFLLPVVLNAQEHVSLTGKWKILVVDAGVQYDFSTDSITVPAAVRQQWRGGSDSSMAMGVIKMLAEEMAGGSYTFAADGSYREMKAEKLLRTGTYKTDEYNGSQMLTLVYLNAAKVETKDYMKYSFDGGRLKLELGEGSEKLVLVLEKTK